VEIAKNECDLGRKFLHELLSITEQLISVACTLWCLVLEEKKPSAFSRSFSSGFCLVGLFIFRVTGSPWLFNLNLWRDLSRKGFRGQSTDWCNWNLARPG